MTPAWAQRQEELLSDCVVFPDVVDHMVDGLRDFVVPYQISLSADAVEDALRRYQTMLASRQQDPQVVAAAYRNVAALVLSIDGLQPEKGHETLYVVRELNAKRIWFAEALLSIDVQKMNWKFRAGSHEQT